jgi:hypothetical protein
MKDNNNKTPADAPLPVLDYINNEFVVFRRDNTKGIFTNI